MTATCLPCLFLRCVEFAGFTVVEKRIPRGLCSNKYTMRICGLQCFTTHLYDMIKYLAIMCPMPLCGDNLVIKRWRTWLAGCNRPRHFSAKQLCEPNFPSRPFPFTPTLSPFCTHPSLSHYIFTMLFIINEDFIICAEYNSQRTQLKVYEGTNLNNRLGQKKNCFKWKASISCIINYSFGSNLWDHNTKSLVHRGSYDGRYTAASSRSSNLDTIRRYSRVEINLGKDINCSGQNLRTMWRIFWRECFTGFSFSPIFSAELLKSTVFVRED